MIEVDSEASLPCGQTLVISLGMPMTSTRSSCKREQVEGTGIKGEVPF